MSAKSTSTPSDGAQRVFRPVPASKDEILKALDEVVRMVKADTLGSLRLVVHGALQGDPAGTYGRLSVIRRNADSLRPADEVEIGTWERLHGLPDLPEQPEPPVIPPREARTPSGTTKRKS